MTEFSDSERVYLETRKRFLDVLTLVDEAKWTEIVPATPLWTARDLLAHLAGAAEDLSSGVYPTAGTFQDWTAAQVERGRDLTVSQLLLQWESFIPALVEELRADRVPKIPLIVDTAVHEQDIRGLLNMPGGRDGPGYRLSVSAFRRRFLDRVEQEGLPATKIVTEERTDSSKEREDGITLRISAFELTRAVGGRRSPSQMRAYDWSSSPDDYVAVMPVFGPRDDDLIEYE